MEQPKKLQTPHELRLQIRNKEFNGHTSGYCQENVQANLVILPQIYAQDFEQYCMSNPKPCPLIEILQPPYLSKFAINSNILTDLPKYKIFRQKFVDFMNIFSRNGQFIEEHDNVKEIVENLNQQGHQMVGFLIGCSFTFEGLLIKQNLIPKHIKQNKNVSMYNTNIDTEPSKLFRGKLVVSMRPYKREQIEKVIELTMKFPKMHGGPIHWNGDYSEIGIENLSKPDYGDPIDLDEDDIPIFWACGVTPQLAIQQARPQISITHSPGCMFVTDLFNNYFLETM